MECSIPIHSMENLDYLLSFAILSTTQVSITSHTNI